MMMSGDGLNLAEAARDGNWDAAVNILNASPEMVRTSLNNNQDRVLHVAVSSKSFDFVTSLLISPHMTPQDLEIRNLQGNTAFCVAAMSNCPNYILDLMYTRNPQLPLILGEDQLLPVHLAASFGHRDIVRHLSSNELLGRMDPAAIRTLFLLTARHNIYDVARTLFDRSNIIDRDRLVTDRIRYGRRYLTALHILAQKSQGRLGNDDGGLFHLLWDHVSRFEPEAMLEVITIPTLVLFDAIESGMGDEAIVGMISTNPRALTLLDYHERHLLHYAAKHGREGILRYVIGANRERQMIHAVDNDGYNILHAAAEYRSQEVWSIFSTKLQRELAWFETVTRIEQFQELTRMRNNDGKTPWEMFYARRTDIFKEDRETVKEMVSSGTVVATLIAAVAFAAVAFAAAVRVPGGDSTRAWFVVFILSNAIALFTSCASIISFLSIFTSSLLNSPLLDQLIIWRTSIEIGLKLVTASVVEMMISCVAALFLIFGHPFKWAAYDVIALGVLLILLLLILRLGYLNGFLWGLRSRLFH